MNKRTLKKRTIELMVELMKTLVPEDQASSVTKESTMMQLAKKTYYKHQGTGSVRLGLCYKKIRSMVKRNPEITVSQIKEATGLA